jgi:hypothetical protein
MGEETQISQRSVKELGQKSICIAKHKSKSPNWRPFKMKWKVQRFNRISSSKSNPSTNIISEL